MSCTVRQIAALLDLEFRGDGDRAISGVSGRDANDGESLVFMDCARGGFSQGFAPACVITTRLLASALPEHVSVIFSEHPKLDFAKAAIFVRPPRESAGTRHQSAVVSPEAVIGSNVEIGPFAVVEEGAKIGDGSVLMTGVFVGHDCVTGNNCVLYPGVKLYPGAALGDRVVLHAGVVVGSDGFGYVSDNERHWKFPQAGGVILENDVEVGANTTIDRGSLGTTRIGEGTKIDNLVQIAHNVEIGRHVVIASQTGISGSTVIEDHAVIGGQVGFGDHARVERGVVIGSKAGVLPGKIVRAGEIYWGVPVRPLREYKRLNALFGRLPDMKAEIESLKAEVARLKSVVSDQ
jgi:UDP-3-O-[3-hydroxymyristoyl] glucosamine N-acyltransferase